MDSKKDAKFWQKHIFWIILLFTFLKSNVSGSLGDSDRALVDLNFECVLEFRKDINLSVSTIDYCDSCVKEQCVQQHV